MTELDLFDELTFLEDDLILEAQELPARKTIRFRGLKKAAVLAAAMMVLLAMTMTVVAGNSGMNPGILHEKYARSDNYSYIWHGHGKCYGVDSDNVEVDRTAYHIDYSHVCTAARAETYTVCTGANLRVTLEATILMPDNSVEYKFVAAEGTDSVTMELDHMVDGEAGTLVYVRSRIFIQSASSRSGAPQWQMEGEHFHYLPQAVGFQLPNGVDVRFPDSKFTYDGRGS